MSGLSARIADSLIESRIIKEEDRGLYEYGIRQFCFATLNLVTEICIGIMCGMLKECIAFLIAYIPLRRFAGGLHAKSELRCYGLSTLVFGVGIHAHWSNNEIYNSFAHTVLRGLRYRGFRSSCRQLRKTAG